MTGSHVEKTVPALFEEQVALTPDKPALRYNGSTVSYAELNARANRLAHHIGHQYDVGLESPVGVLLPRSIEAVVSIMAILKAGGFYVPLDPTFPKQRLSEIAEDVHPKVILTSTKTQGAKAFPKSELLYLDTLEEILSNEDRNNLDRRTTPDNLAYVMYTSGSTGRPKGVAGIHRSITNGLAEIPGGQESVNDVWGLNVSLCFGASVARLFLPLLSGRLVAVAPDEHTTDTFAHVKFIEREGVTNVLLITPLLREILLAGSFLSSSLKSVRTIVTGGAPMTDDLLNLFREQLPQATLADGYAVTEVGGAVMVRALHREPFESHIFPHTQVYIVDDDWRECPQGQAGEILVGANHLSRSYWAQPALTAERFLPNPFSPIGGARLYRTGDIGRYLPDGRLELLGRTDNQVKVRGFRVEISEIEAYLHGHAEIREAAVLGDGVGADVRLICYVVPRSPSILSVRELREYLSHRFPEYMVPSKFTLLSEGLPRTSTGKVDRQGLATLQQVSETEISEDYIAPITEAEIGVAQIFCEVLQLERVGLSNDFLELGGHSLLGIQVISKIRSRFGVDVPFQALFAPSNVAQLGVLITAARTETRAGEAHA